MEPIWIVLLVVCSLLVITGILYFVLTHPHRANEKLKKYTAYKYAHRGLHDALHAENSLSAFRLAVSISIKITSGL